MSNFWPDVDLYLFYIFKNIGQGDPEHQVIKLVWPESVDAHHCDIKVRFTII